MSTKVMIPETTVSILPASVQPNAKGNTELMVMGLVVGPRSFQVIPCGSGV
jgi:hypothetical protein